MRGGVMASCPQCAALVSPYCRNTKWHDLYGCEVERRVSELQRALSDERGIVIKLCVENDKLKQQQLGVGGRTSGSPCCGHTGHAGHCAGHCAEAASLRRLNATLGSQVSSLREQVDEMSNVHREQVMVLERERAAERRRVQRLTTRLEDTQQLVQDTTTKRCDAESSLRVCELYRDQLQCVEGEVRSLREEVDVWRTKYQSVSERLKHKLELSHVRHMKCESRRRAEHDGFRTDISALNDKLRKLQKYMLMTAEELCVSESDVKMLRDLYHSNPNPRPNPNLYHSNPRPNSNPNPLTSVKTGAGPDVASQVRALRGKLSHLEHVMTRHMTR